MAESFRSGLEAVSQTQQEIGLAIGLTPLQVFRYVVLPQATAVALPSFSATIAVLFLDGRFSFWIGPLLNNIYPYIKRHFF